MKHKKIISLVLLVIFCMSSTMGVLASSDAKYYRQKAKEYYQKAKDETEKAQDAMDKANYYQEKAEDYADSSSTSLDKAKDYYKDAKSNLKGLGITAVFAFDLRSVTKMIKSVRGLSLGHNLVLIALAAEVLDDLEQCESYIEDSLEYDRKSNICINNAENFTDDADVYMSNAEKYIDKAKYYEKLADQAA